MAGHGGTTGTGGIGGTTGTGGIGGTTGTGGVAGGGGTVATGGAGGAGGCAEVPICTVGAGECLAGVPQTCALNSLGCPDWVAQPACDANQTCSAATGMCVCNPQAACGAAGAEVAGDFCPTAGAATHSTCTKGADGCFTVTTGVACAGSQVCNVTPATMVVPVGTACGCPAPLPASTPATTPLLGTGCTAAQATAGTRLGSKADNAVLICQTVNGCPIWQISTNCASQQLTGGTDPVTTLPACVCAAPSTANQYYVDPNPTMSTFMTGGPTGAQFPAACRFRTLTTALAQTGVTQVIAQHESSSNVHFLNKAGTPAVPNCSTPNSCEVFPINIPAGVHVFTSDQGSFNPAHYVIDVDTVNTAGYAVSLANGARFEGYSIDTSGSTAVNTGTGVASVILSPPTLSTAAALNQILLITRPGQIGLEVRGQSNWTADFLSVVETSPAALANTIGVLVDRNTDTTGTATLVATHLNVSLASAGSVGVQVGCGATGTCGASAAAASAAADAADILRITNDAVDATGGRTVSVGNGGIGVHIFGGSVETDSVAVGTVATTAVPAPSLTGYRIDNSTAQTGTVAAPAFGVVIDQGSVTGTNGGGIGVLTDGGDVTINGTHITGGTGWTGVSVQSTTPASATSIAGSVTLTGTAALPTLIDTLPLTNTTATVGVLVATGTESATAATLPALTIADNTTVTGYADGVIVNNGHVISTGTGVVITANGRDGFQDFSTLNLAGTNPMDPLSRVSVTGATISNNGRLGILVRDIAPAAFIGVKVTGNGTPIAGSSFAAAGGFPEGTGGVDVQKSQITGNTAFLFSMTGNSHVSGNTGCGLTLSGGNDDLVNRTSSNVGGVRICGVGVSTTNVPGPIPATTATGGKVSADIENTIIQNNTGVGLYITEARDGTTDVTEVSLQLNTVTGNLSVVPATGAEPGAGGIYVASSNFTSGANPPTNPDAVGCDTTGDCTRIRIATFLGNNVACNGRAQLAFAVPQRVNGMANSSGWDISSSGTIVNLTDRCAVAALPNTLAGYAAGVNIGLSIPAAATNAMGISLIDVAAFGVHWQNANPVAGADYSSGLATAPQGNDDATTWGFCPASPTACPVALVP